MSKNKFVRIGLLAAVAIIVLTGCTRTDEDDILEIRERMFVTQINDIYMNASEFLGKRIKLEGIFTSDTWGDPLHFVLRRSPGGCCGTDGRTGFEVKWPEGRRDPYPAENSWVEATGTLKYTVSDNRRFLYLELSSLRVLTTRREEFVTR